MTLSLALSSTITQRFLSQSTLIGYLARGAYRSETAVPSDRVADYQFRDFWHPLIFMFWVNELLFRVAQSSFAFPLMRQALELDKLQSLYGTDPRFADGPIANMRSLTDIPELRKRLIGSTVRVYSNSLIPDLFRREMAEKALSADEARQVAVIAHHLKRRLNTRQYLIDEMQAAPDVAEATIEQAKTLGKRQSLLDEHLESLLAHADKKQVPVEVALQDFVRRNRVRVSDARDLKPYLLKAEALYRAVHAATTKAPTLDGLDWEGLAREQNLDASVTQELHRYAERLKTARAEAGQGPLNRRMLVEQLEGWLMDHVEETALATSKTRTLLREALDGNRVAHTLRKIQKASHWPGIALSVVMTLPLTLLTTWLDINVVQKWERKITDQGIKANIVNWPTYLGLLPFAGVLALTQFDRITPGPIRRLGYIARWTVSGALALMAYGATVYGLTQFRLNNNPPRYNGDEQPGANRPKALPAPAPLFTRPTLAAPPPLFRDILERRNALTDTR